MTRSLNFWAGIVLFAIIPLLLIDITVHSINWHTEVRDEIITVVQNVYSFDQAQKAAILDRILERNQTLTFLIYIKSFASLFLLGSSLYFFNRYRKEGNTLLWKPALTAIAVLVLFLAVKTCGVDWLAGNNKIKILSPADTTYSLQKLHAENFKGKVVYVDFWGTTCGPCLQEFRDFMQPLKKRYASNKNISYLYIAQGNKYLWKQQLEKYQVEGDHIFLTEKQYEKLYRQSVQDSSGVITMPRYLILNKQGEIVITDAKRPSNRDSLYTQLDKYLPCQ